MIRVAPKVAENHLAGEAVSQSAAMQRWRRGSDAPPPAPNHPFPIPEGLKWSCLGGLATGRKEGTCYHGGIVKFRCAGQGKVVPGVDTR